MRLSALRGELATAFAQSARATCSNEEMDDLEKFSHHFGAIDLRDSLCKLLELSEENSRAEIPSDCQLSSKRNLENDRINRKQENNQKCNQPQSDTPVKYSASPAKAAQVERESSSESGESSCSSDEEQPSMQRSRTLIRSASPRRSASPMRRVQIGRSGSRRSTALTIKSLNYLPRERLSSQKDAAPESSDEEASEQPSKRSEINVKRISVQDAISLFESKQRDQTMDIQKTKSLLNVKVGANKSVLRRWSAGAGENFSEDPQRTDSHNAVALPSDGVESTGITNESLDGKAEHDLPPENDAIQPAEVGIKLDSPEPRLANAACAEDNAVCSQTAEISENLTGSAEWSRQKEAELNQLLMKMMETKPVKYQTGAPANGKSQNLPSERRGGFYDHYKEKRNEKLRGETAGKRAEKEKQFRAMQQILDARKAEMASANGSDAGRKQNVKPQKSQKVSSPANHKKEISKPSVVKKASPKASPLPATRKSWPTTASPRPTSISSAKTPPGTTSAGTTTRRKSQPAPPVPRLSPKVERSQLKPKPLKPTQNDTSKGVKNANEKQQPLKKFTKSAKPKLQSVDRDAASSAKPSFYSKVTKKSSVVPIESKPFLRKGSGIGSGVSPVSRTKVPPQSEDTLIVTGDTNQAEENEIVSSSSDQVIEQQEVSPEANKDHADMEFNVQVNQEKHEEMETPVEVAFTEHDDFQNLTDADADAALNTRAAEELDIPPTAWVEIEEHEEEPAPFSGMVCQIQSPSSVAPVGIPSSRVRHSLSQMLLEESSEPDVVEWGNAENPPAMVYQKDVPKGLKRLLKFARKSKADTNSTGCSTPSVFSEGEDDTDESKLVTKRSSDNLLKKATLHAKNLGHQNTSSEDKSLAAHGTHAQANVSKTIGHRLSEKLQEGNISAPVTSSKATRSFFSLSAFKGGKQNEVKFL